MVYSISIRKLIRVCCLGAVCGLSACGSATYEEPTPADPVPITVSPTPSRTPQPSRTPPPTSVPATSTLARTPTPAILICSPLQGVEAADLAAAVVNPFNPPPPGSDDFHQGVDLGDLDPVSRIALTGRSVQAVLAGRVAAVVENKFPYGNAVLIETPLKDLPPEWVDLFAAPTPVANPVTTSLTCPDLDLPPWDSTARSLYLLYAHLEAGPDLLIDDHVDCGGPLGLVGSSGNALNPHLHLEFRVGPSGARFPGLAHYDTAAGPEEMAGYCAWRVGGDFLILDPLALFNLD